MLRRRTPAIATSLSQNVLPAFGFEPDLAAHPMLKSLLTKLDNVSLQATPTAAPDWVATVTPLALPAGVNVFARTLTDGIWCTSQDGFYSVVTTVSYDITLDLGKVKDWLSSNFGQLTPKSWSNSTSTSLNAVFTFTQTAIYTPEDLAQTPVSGLYHNIVSVAFDLGIFELHVELDGTSIRALIVPTGTDNIGSMITRAFDTASSGLTRDMEILPGSGSALGDIFTAVFSNVYLWHISVGFDSNAGLAWSFGLIVSLPLTFGGTTSSDHAIITLLYDSSAKTFTGRFVGKQALKDESLVRAATWDPRVDPTALLKTTGLYDHMVDGIDFLAVVGLDVTNCPVSLVLEDAEISFTRGSPGTASILSLYGVFSTLPGVSCTVPMPFKWDAARIDVDIYKGTKTTFDISLFDAFEITGKSQATGESLTATFSILLRYQNLDQVGHWTIAASARNLSVALIRSFFNDDAQDSVMAVLGGLTLANADVVYTFATKQASAFTMRGTLLLGDLELDLTYLNPDPSSPSGWSFTATLRVDSPDSTIGKVAESIVPGASDSLPSFIGDIPVSPKSSNVPVCLLKINHATDPQKGTATALTVWLSIGGLSFTFIQYTSRAKSPAKGVLKRILRITADQIPLMDKIPVIDHLPQPFDQLIYMWVGDDSSKLTGPSKPDSSRLGFSQVELQDLQSLLPSEIPPIQIKQTAPPKSNDSPIALAHGHHFAVIVGGRVVLDHVFDTNKEDSSDTPAPANSPPVVEARPTKGNTTTKAGLLSIGALTVKYKSGHLIVTVDATLTLGPLTFSVIGFALNLNLSKVRLDHLGDIVTQGLISASLNGLQVGMTKGPLTVDGVFIHDKTAAGESYRGGIVVGFKAWQVLAIGEYFVHFDAQGKEDYKAVFV